MSLGEWLWTGHRVRRWTLSPQAGSVPLECQILFLLEKEEVRPFREVWEHV